MQLAPLPTTIDPQLLAHSHLPPLSPELIPVSGLQSKYAGPATTTNWRSGIPRLAQAPIAPELPVEMDVGDSSTAEANTSGMSDDTARRLAKLQSMLSKLAMPRASVGGSSSPAEARASGRGPKVERRRTIGTSAGAYQEEYEVPLSDAPAAKPRASISGPTASTSGGQSNIRTPRRSSVGVLSSSSTAMIAAIAEGEVSAKPKSKVLQGVVAFVDVRTLEGDDAGMIFVDMLKSMGARVSPFSSSFAGSVADDRSAGDDATDAHAHSHRLQERASRNASSLPCAPRSQALPRRHLVGRPLRRDWAVRTRGSVPRGRRQGAHVSEGTFLASSYDERRS